MTIRKNSVDLALVCKNKDYVHEAHGLVRTESWVVGKKRAKTLINKTVVLTDGQKKPAYLGGKIVDIERIRDNKYSIRFKEDRSLIGNTSSISHPNWGNEKCYLN